MYRGPDGNRVWKSTGQTNRQKALKVAIEWEKAAQRAREGALTEVQARKVLSEIVFVTRGERLNFHTVREWFEGWLADKEKAKAGATAKRYVTIIRAFLASLGKRADANLATIGPTDVRAFRDGEAKAGKAARTCNFSVKVIGACLNSARRLGYIDTNPTHAVESMREAPGGRRGFSPEQIEAMIRAASPDWGGAIRVAYFAGLRLQDIAGLRWRNVDLPRGTLRFLPQKTAASGRELTVPLHPELEAYLLSLESPDDDEQPLFGELHGRDTSSLSKSFSDIMDRARVENVQLRARKGAGRSTRALSFHSFRHTFNTALANGGVVSEIRQELAGHTSAEVNRQYTHRELDPLRKAIAVIPGIDPSGTSSPDRARRKRKAE